jgi:excisionase family DNA binding protein
MLPQPASVPVLDVAQRYSVPEAIALLRTSRRSIYQLIADGRIRPIKQGRRTFISGASIAALSQAPA